MDPIQTSHMEIYHMALKHLIPRFVDVGPEWIKSKSEIKFNCDEDPEWEFSTLYLREIPYFQMRFLCALILLQYIG